MAEKLSVEVRIPAISFQSDCLFPTGMAVSDGIALVASLAAPEGALDESDVASLGMFHLEGECFLTRQATFSENGVQHGAHIMLI